MGVEYNSTTWAVSHAKPGVMSMIASMNQKKGRLSCCLSRLVEFRIVVSID